MKANPGGQIALNEVVGRDEIIRLIWDTLEQQSISMNAERRIGKTTIMNKLKDEPKNGWQPIYRDLEQFHSAEQFAESVYHAVESFLSRTQKTARRCRELMNALGGTEIKISVGGGSGQIKLPESNAGDSWKALLNKAIEDLVEENGKNQEKLLFLWDEMPFMLDNIKNRQGAAIAMEVLDMLRALRQSYGGKGLRMVLTGSIGFHHIIQSLKDQRYSNAPLNDVYPLDIPTLSPAAAKQLTDKLLCGEQITCQDQELVAQCITDSSDGFPYYIHHIVKAQKLSGKAADPAGIALLVEDQLLNAGDPWELSHYRTRIPIYYGNELEKTVLSILDCLAVNYEQAVNIAAILTDIGHQGIQIEREKLLKLLKLLEQDHYLRRSNEGYRFRFSLIRRWWLLSRGL